MKIKKDHREKTLYYLKQFYKYYPNERFTIMHFVASFKRRLKNNRDAWMAVCGETGTGKSLFVIMSMILFGRPMDLTKNVAYIPKGEEVVKMFDSLKFNCLLIDEAAREMRAVNWQSKQQQAVNQKAMTDRFKNNWVFLNMPNFNEFTKSMRRSNLLFRAVLPYRTDKYARVIIQRKSRNWRSDDPWGDKEADDIYKRMTKKKQVINNEKILLVERSLPNTVMDFIVPNLELICPDIANEYERLKAESRITKEEEAVAKKQNLYQVKYKEAMTRSIKYLFVDMKLKKAEISRALKISPATVTSYLNQEIAKSGT